MVARTRRSRGRSGVALVAVSVAALVASLAVPASGRRLSTDVTGQDGASVASTVGEELDQVVAPPETYPVGFGSVAPVPPPPEAFREDGVLLAIAADEKLLAGYVEMDLVFRTSFGLRADRGYVEDLYRHPEKSIGRRVGGALFTPEEAEELDIRSQLEADAVVVEKALGESPAFGGVFIDNATGTLVLAATDPKAVSVPATSLRYPERLEVRVVERSFDQLQAIQAAIVDQIESGGLADVSSVGIRVKENKVVVHVRPDSPTGRLDPAGAVNAISSRALVPAEALRVDIVLDAFETLDVDPNAPAVIGGNSVGMTGSAGGCSAAFEVVQPFEIVLPGQPQPHYVLTAGHCFRDVAAGTVAAIRVGESAPRAPSGSTSMEGAQMSDGSCSMLRRWRCRWRR